VIAAFVLGGANALAQSAEDAAPSRSAQRWLLLICGLPGDDEHERAFAETSLDITATLSRHDGFAGENTYFCAGAVGPLQSAPQGSQTAFATREGVLTTLKTLASSVAPHDEF